MSEQSQLGPSQDGSVVLDIGGTIGALIISATERFAGREEISPFGEPTVRTHVAVRERLGPSGTRYAAIYPSLSAGAYTVWKNHSQPSATVHITGGAITQLQWDD